MHFDGGYAFREHGVPIASITVLAEAEHMQSSRYRVPAGCSHFKSSWIFVPPSFFRKLNSMKWIK